VMPSGVAPGGDVPLLIEQKGRTSAPVTVPIR